VLLFAAGVALLALATRDLRRVASFTAGFALAALPAAAYLAITFETVLPVSSYAKLNGLGNLAHGVAYVARAARATHAAYVLPLALLGLLARPVRLAGAAALGFVALWTCAVAVEGGDFMAYDRFLSPVWPLWCLAVGLGLAALGRGIESRLPRRPEVAAACVTLLALSIAAAWAAPSWRGAERDAYDRSGRDELAREAIGRYLASRFPDSDWIAVKPAGIIPYYSRLRAVDFFCITDLEAARTGTWVPDAWPGHQRMNPGRIHDLAPRLAILEARLYPLASLPPPGTTDPNHGGSWLADPRAARYQPVRAEVLPGLWLNLLVRR
jgi:hypothetical protein